MSYKDGLYCTKNTQHGDFRDADSFLQHNLPVPAELVLLYRRSHHISSPARPTTTLFTGLNQTIGPHLRILLCFSQMRNCTRLIHNTLKHSSGLLTWINPPLRSLIDTGPHKPNCPLETCMLTPLSLIACCLFYTQPMHMSLPRYVCWDFAQLNFSRFASSCSVTLRRVSSIILSFSLFYSLLSCCFLLIFLTSF